MLFVCFSSSFFPVKWNADIKLTLTMVSSIYLVTQTFFKESLKLY